MLSDADGWNLYFTSKPTKESQWSKIKNEIACFVLFEIIYSPGVNFNIQGIFILA